MLFFVANEAVRGVLQPLDGAGRWLCQINVDARRVVARRLHPRARARRGSAPRSASTDLEPEILSLGLWKLNATVVERLVQGRVLMCGDAAHQFPPTGGLGVNTGLQGMHNAMWKLAYFVHGRAAWPLVETYDTERRDVAQRITSQSLQNSMNVLAHLRRRGRGRRERASAPTRRSSRSRRYGNHLGVEFGAAYDSSAVVADGTSPPVVADSYSDYVQTRDARLSRAARLARTARRASSRRSTCSAPRSRCSPRPTAARGARWRPTCRGSSASAIDALHDRRHRPAGPRRLRQRVRPGGGRRRARPTRRARRLAEPAGPASGAVLGAALARILGRRSTHHA